MPVEILCRKCWFTGEDTCIFKKTVDQIANAEGMTDKKKTDAIEKIRKDALDRGCPSANHNPDIQSGK